MLSGELHCGVVKAGGIRIRIAVLGEAVVRIAVGIGAAEFRAELARRLGAICREDSDHPLVQAAARQLLEYLQGQRREFDLPVACRGTAFQRRVWRALREIPYGETRSYADLARAVGAPRAARAVGAANAANPIAIVVPCHRVIRADGSLGGYGGGQRLKRRLLELERAVRAARPLRPSGR